MQRGGDGGACELAYTVLLLPVLRVELLSCLLLYITPPPASPYHMVRPAG